MLVGGGGRALKKQSVLDWCHMSYIDFCRGHPVVLFLTVRKIQLLPSDTTNNIIITMTVGD